MNGVFYRYNYNNLEHEDILEKSIPQIFSGLDKSLIGKYSRIS